MRTGAIALIVLLSACDGTSTPETQPGGAISSAPPSRPAPTQSPRAIGQVSGLTGQTSPLTGMVSDFVVERTATGTRVQLAADTLFEFDKAMLSPAAQANLQRTADLVREAGEGTITVVGYTDAKGGDAYNNDLSKRRAEAVVAWLRSQPGIAQAFAAVGRGEAEPIAPNTRPDGSDDPDGRARNRRVVVNIPR